MKKKLLFLSVGIVFLLLLYFLSGWIRTAEQLKRLSDGSIPGSLVELYERNPEAWQFVLDYPAKKDQKEEIRLSGEITQGEIPLFLQWDERWGYETYGDDFLAVTGCGPTCLAMVSCGLSGSDEWNPYAVAQMAQQAGYYVYGVGSSWELMTNGAEEMGLSGKELVFDEAHILAALREGQPIICAMRKGDFTDSGHFIVLKAADEEGRILLCDPNSRKNSEKAWELSELMPQIKNLWGYSLA